MTLLIVLNEIQISIMRLYHFIKVVLAACILLLAGSACSSSPPPPTPQEEISVQIEVDGQFLTASVPAGSAVSIALESAGITLTGKDRVEPAGVVLLTDDAEIRVIRVEEIIETEQVVIPFQVIRQPTENLPTGQEKLLQAGKNGLKEVAYVRVFEDGQEISFGEINSLGIDEAVDEIILVGIQSSIAPIALPSPLVYISNGNAWMMDQSTANRSLIVPTGDLDGRIFRLSKDGNWLLFSRTEEDEDIINSLWAIEIGSYGNTLVELDTENVIYFADWVPGTEQVFAYSTVEPRISAPGWQANNDLIVKRFSESGWTSTVEILQDTYYGGGFYGWWGTDFQYSPEGDFLAFASPSQVGIITTAEDEDQEKIILLELTTYKTQGDWAWMPGIGIGPLGNVIYSVDHVAQEGNPSTEESPVFDLVAIPLTGGGARRIVHDVGMFAYPLPSPVRAKPSGEASFQVAYLQAVFPERSATSNYRVALMDRDGSNQHLVFPAIDKPGLQPSQGWGAWSPEEFEAGTDYPLAVIYEGNIWILNLGTGDFWQVTGDGRVQGLDW
ncbi:MAG: G5 domain-containing protein [Anaerolineales bacterium]|nr:G5 domain-containing protein [Anaerolineales bacterium]